MIVHGLPSVDYSPYHSVQITQLTPVPYQLPAPGPNFQQQPTNIVCPLSERVEVLHTSHPSIHPANSRASERHFLITQLKTQIKEELNDTENGKVENRRIHQQIREISKFTQLCAANLRQGCVMNVCKYIHYPWQLNQEGLVMGICKQGYDNCKFKERCCLAHSADERVRLKLLFHSNVHNHALAKHPFRLVPQLDPAPNTQTAVFAEPLRLMHAPQAIPNPPPTVFTPPELQLYPNTIPQTPVYAAPPILVPAPVTSPYETPIAIPSAQNPHETLTATTYQQPMLAPAQRMPYIPATQPEATSGENQIIKDLQVKRKLLEELEPHLSRNKNVLQELRDTRFALRKLLHKTSLCAANIRIGYCTHGYKCGYIHKISECKGTKHSIALCSKGLHACSFKDFCVYAHSPEEREQLKLKFYEYQYMFM